MRENMPPDWRQRRMVRGIERPGGVGPDPGEPPLIAAPRRAPRPARWFTAHLGFTAAGPEQARDLAVAYVEALSLLRPELVLGVAAWSPADAWHRAERLFCGAPRGRTANAARTSRATPASTTPPAPAAWAGARATGEPPAPLSPGRTRRPARRPRTRPTRPG
ncbi:hypothetical protein MRQ36_06255 [Micromonospora sp. R77]|uniref:hypothetical protein n=1 Tax=Micromonospora sp. R77 TaxID=2925836 RepID=UPI001F6165CE|nr:hypothetical protein [Micromonospora sp. R77]MCI4062190.1 hypothetical protein [Micromonospora sp. R77]